jgi:branched-subunit amino acid transport protein AzlD
MSPWYSLLIIFVTAISTLFTRATPFVLFGNGRKRVPKAVLYLGSVLPPAVMAILVVYSLRNIDFATPPGWAAHIISVAATAVIHVLRRNTLLSIAVGTGVHMVLVQAVFL